MSTFEDYLLNYVDSITYYSLMFQKFSEKFEKPYICTVNSMSMAGQALSSDMIYTLVIEVHIVATNWFSKAVIYTYISDFLEVSANRYNL